MFVKSLSECSSVNVKKTPAASMTSFLIMVVMATLNLALAGYKTRCDVVRALRAQGVPDGDMRDWLCLVDNESKFKYDATYINPNNRGTDNGIFQMNSRYHCDRPSGYSGTKCWKLNTDGCQDTCSSFLDSDISNDANCAVRVKTCGGFNKWAAWRDKCKGKNLAGNSAYNYSDC